MARSFERDPGRTPHKLSGHRLRRKSVSPASSFHGDPAGLAIDTVISPRIDGDLPIDFPPHIGRRQGHVPWLRLVCLSLRRKSYVAFQIEKGLDLRHQPVEGHITDLAT
jgi:hypothetical protein